MGTTVPDHGFNDPKNQSTNALATRMEAHIGVMSPSWTKQIILHQILQIKPIFLCPLRRFFIRMTSLLRQNNFGWSKHKFDLGIRSVNKMSGQQNSTIIWWMKQCKCFRLACQEMLYYDPWWFHHAATSSIIVSLSLSLSLLLEQQGHLQTSIVMHLHQVLYQQAYFTSVCIF